MGKKAATLNFGDSLIIENTKNLKEKFDKMAKSGASILLESEIISEIDLSGIQLLNYMVYQGRKKNAKLQFKIKFDENQRLLLEKCGFTNNTEIGIT